MLSSLGLCCLSGPGLALRTASPVDDLGFVDLVAHVVVRRQAGRGADRAVDVGGTAADAADHVVMIVADPGLEARRRRRPAGSSGISTTLSNLEGLRE